MKLSIGYPKITAFAAFTCFRRFDWQNSRVQRHCCSDSFAVAVDAAAGDIEIGLGSFNQLIQGLADVLGDFRPHSSCIGRIDGEGVAHAALRPRSCGSLQFAAGAIPGLRSAPNPQRARPA